MPSLGAKSIDDASKILLSRGQGDANALALAYKTHLIEQGLQAATVNRRLAALRSVVKLARTLGLTLYTLSVETVRFAFHMFLAKYGFFILNATA